MKSSSEVERILTETRAATTESADTRIGVDAREAFIESTRHRPTASGSGLIIWRRMMKNAIIRLTVAAVIVIAAALGISHFGGSVDGTSVVWAKVAEQFDVLPAFVHREKRIAVSDGKEISLLRSDVVGYYSPEYGMREDMYNEDGLLLHQVYTLWAEEKSVTVQPALKQYKVVELDSAKLEQFRSNLRRLMQPVKSGEYTALGRKKIGEVEVEGIEINDPDIMAGSGYPIKFDRLTVRLWADVETSAIVQVESEASTSDEYVTRVSDGKPVEIKAVTTGFQWDAELDASYFEPNIADDYTPLPE